MSNESFDDFLSTDFNDGSLEMKPFQFRDAPKSKEETLNWLNNNFDAKLKKAESRLNTYNRRKAYFKGIQWRQNDSRDSSRNSDSESSVRKPRHVVNFIWDMLDQKVAQMSRLGVHTSMIPVHDEISDRSNAKACKHLMQSRKEELDLDGKHDEADLVKFLYGTSFMLVDWNESMGPLNKQYKTLKEQINGKVPLMERGKKVKGKFMEDIHMGDVDVTVLGPDRVFPELNVTDWKKVNEVDVLYWENKYEMQAQYPKVADALEGGEDFLYESETNEMNIPKDRVAKRVFYHKRTKYLPEGAMIIYTRSAILEWKKYPFKDDELPLVPDRDIVIPDELWGRSFIDNIEQMQRMYNNIQSGQARDYGIGSAPKWLVQKGSTKISSLNNEFVVVEYTGMQKPELSTPSPTNDQGFKVQDRLERRIGGFSRVYDSSRGEVPQGVTANSALRFLDEKESEVIAPTQKKRKKRVIAVEKKMLIRMQQGYGQDDERMATILGKNNVYTIRSFKKADFTKISDIKIQNQSALPDSKSGKISTIVDLNISTQTDPIFRREEVIQMLDLAMDEAFTDGATVAAEAAKTTVEEMLDGEQVPEVRACDNFLVYYSIFDRAMQSFTFRKSVPEEIGIAFQQYVEVLEGMMWQRAKKNFTFAQSLSTLDNFPMYFETEEPLTAILMKHQMAGQPPVPEEPPKK